MKVQLAPHAGGGVHFSGFYVAYARLDVVADAPLGNRPPAVRVVENRIRRRRVEVAGLADAARVYEQLPVNVYVKLQMAVPEYQHILADGQNFAACVRVLLDYLAAVGVELCARGRSVEIVQNIEPRKPRRARQVSQIVGVVANPYA